MSEEVVGVVQAISAKQLASGLYHSFVMDEVWYRTGKNKVEGIEKGNRVKFEFDEDKYGKHLIEATFDFKVGEAPEPAAKKSYNAAPKNNTEFWAAKELRDIDTQKRISFQAATNSATALVNSALEQGFLTKPTGNAAKKFPAYTAMVFEETLRLYKLYQEVPENSDTYIRAQELDSGVDVDLEELSPEMNELPDTEDW